MVISHISRNQIYSAALSETLFFFSPCAAVEPTTQCKLHKLYPKENTLRSFQGPGGTRVTFLCYMPVRLIYWRKHASREAVMNAWHLGKYDIVSPLLE